MGELRGELQEKDLSEKEKIFETTKRSLDYDDEPYGDENIQIRSYKRRALLSTRV